ncbi:hypothetical protein GEW_09569, partial [Pasteurella multocida subsp. gallicida str. Anand1_poultry]
MTIATGGASGPYNIIATTLSDILQQIFKNQFKNAN